MGSLTARHAARGPGFAAASKDNAVTTQPLTPVLILLALAVICAVLPSFLAV